MRAMVLDGIHDLSTTRTPLTLRDVPDPQPGTEELLLSVSACGVCHTELDEIEGRTPPPRFPVILGHQVIGRVAETGHGVRNFKTGDRAGIAWINYACGICSFCLSGQENLCEEFRATGRDVNGGYAELVCIHERFASPIPDCFSDVEAAPLLCAGAIGYRSLKLSSIENGDSLGLTGFGASGHLMMKMVRHRFPDTDVFVFARSPAERQFALDLGASWSGNTTEQSPVQLHAIIDTTPAWLPVVAALKNLKSGGRLVINAIRKEEYDKNEWLHLDYARDLWLEKEIKSVANVTRDDVIEFLDLASKVPIKPEFELYPLEEVNRALLELKERKIRGAKVLVMGEGKF